MGESDLQRQIRDFLKLMKVRHWRNNTGRAFMGGRPVSFGEKGMPDLSGRLPNGRPFWIEVKSSTKLSPEQEKWRDEILSWGEIYILAKSLDDVRKGLYYENHLGADMAASSVSSRG